MMGSYLRVLPSILTLHSFIVTLFTLGLRLFYPVVNKQQLGSVPGNPPLVFSIHNKQEDLPSACDACRSLSFSF